MTMARIYLCWTVIPIIFLLCTKSNAKLSDEENKTSGNVETPQKTMSKMHSNSGLIFADELKQTLERYLFGICPQTFKMPLINRNRSNTTAAMTCDLDSDHNDLAGRLATLALRAHSASRTECSQLSTALANTFSELARTASNRQFLNSAASTNDANKKRKLSKSQKAKIQAKQRTALAVKKKAASLAAAAAAKTTA